MKPVNKVYIAGPMSGLPEFNRPAFHKAADHIITRGDIALNPATLPGGLEQHQYMDICFAMVRAADRVMMLPRWQDSAGAVAEYHYAKKLGLPIDKACMTIDGRHCRGCPDCQGVMGDATYKEMESALKEELGHARMEEV